MKTILATLTIVLGLLSVAPAMADPINTDNKAQSNTVFTRIGGQSGGE